MLHAGDLSLHLLQVADLAHPPDAQVGQAEEPSPAAASDAADAEAVAVAAKLEGAGRTDTARTTPGIVALIENIA